jgi:hypothetical protein
LAHLKDTIIVNFPARRVFRQTGGDVTQVDTCNISNIQTPSKAIHTIVCVPSSRSNVQFIHASHNPINTIITIAINANTIPLIPPNKSHNVLLLSRYAHYPTGRALCKGRRTLSGVTSVIFHYYSNY